MNPQIKSINVIGTDSEKIDLIKDSIAIEFGIGPAESKGEELFTIEVITYDSLVKLLSDKGYFIPRNSMIINSCRYSTIIDILKNRIESTFGNNWDEIALKLNKFMLWEFEDYK